MTKRAVYVTEHDGREVLALEYVTDESWDLVSGALTIRIANSVVDEALRFPEGDPAVELVSEDGTVLALDITKVAALRWVNLLEGETGHGDELSPEAAGVLEP